GARIRSGTSSCGLVINVVKASEHRYRDDLSSLSASMRRACSRCAGRPLSQRSMRAPVVEIANRLKPGQAHTMTTLLPDETHSSMPSLAEIGRRLKLQEGAVTVSTRTLIKIHEPRRPQIAELGNNC